jgi:CheY-like chemotaxis protein
MKRSMLLASDFFRPGPVWAHLDTTTKAGGNANRNAGFIRQPRCGSPACRMNPAFRWWYQDAPGRSSGAPERRGLASRSRRVFIEPVCEAMNKPKAESGGRGKSDGRLIYLVDDEPMLLELASVILAPLGYALETYGSAEAASHAFEIAEPKPALIITDYAMHRMNGLELAEVCRRIRPNQRVLLVSGTVGPEACEGVRARPDRFLAKPYEAKEFIDAVKAVLAA